MAAEMAPSVLARNLIRLTNTLGINPLIAEASFATSASIEGAAGRGGIG
jgi:hypothetical protein